MVDVMRSTTAVVVQHLGFTDPYRPDVEHKKKQITLWHVVVSFFFYSGASLAAEFHRLMADAVDS